MRNHGDKKSEGITWISSQSLIQLRLQANQLPLDSGKIHAKQGGAYLSSFKGRGMEFDESRIYQAGDDIRNMDWRVTARTGLAHTKVFREERERPILLWLDLLNSPDMRGRPTPMGSETTMNENPIFQVRAAGSFDQMPGCPDYAATALGAERLENVCRGECYNPSAKRRPITRIEVVRIRPQNSPDEAIAPLIEDPWRTFECDGSPEGCSITFDDPEYASLGRDTVYYVRALEAPAPGINAGGVRCERDAEGNCLTVTLCNDPTGEDQCLADHEPRAWSSPIFVDWKTRS